MLPVDEYVYWILQSAGYAAMKIGLFLLLVENLVKAIIICYKILLSSNARFPSYRSPLMVPYGPRMAEGNRELSQIFICQKVEGVESRI